MVESKKEIAAHPNGLTLLQLTISSCAGALITSIFMTPFDVVKVRLQTQQRESLRSKCFVYCNGIMDHICNCTPACASEKTWYNRPVPVYFNGTFDAFLKISRSEGVHSLWSGLPPTLIVAIPNTVIYLTAYERILTTFKSFDVVSINPGLSGGLAGALARGWSVTVVSPFELLRTKIQSKNSSYKEVFGVLRHEFLAAGPTSLWRGWGASIMRDVPFSALYWSMYESLKFLFNQKHPTPTFSLTAGAVAGGAAAMVTLPLDVVKTHQQIAIGESLFSGKMSNKVDSISTILENIYRQQGIRGLFTGSVPRLAKIMPACGVMISSYEYAKAYFRKKNYPNSY